MTFRTFGKVFFGIATFCMKSKQFEVSGGIFSLIYTESVQNEGI